MANAGQEQFLDRRTKTDGQSAPAALVYSSRDAFSAVGSLPTSSLRSQLAGHAEDQAF